MIPNRPNPWMAKSGKPLWHFTTSQNFTPSGNQLHRRSHTDTGAFCSCKRKREGVNTMALDLKWTRRNFMSSLGVPGEAILHPEKLFAPPARASPPETKISGFGE